MSHIILSPEWDRARATRNAAWDALRATDAAPGTPEHQTVWDALVAADAVLDYLMDQHARARVGASFSESVDGDRIDHYPAAPVPADPARADAIEYRAELTVDDHDGALIHLAAVRDRTGWRDCGEPLTPAAARALAGELTRLADLADDADRDPFGGDA